MDASDILRKTQAKTIYANYKTNGLNNGTTAQRTACSNAQTNCSSIAVCITTYPSYEFRQYVVTGSAACNNCSNVGCGCGQ